MESRDKMAYQRYGVKFEDTTAEQRDRIAAALERPIKSADRQPLSNGTRVFTNNLDTGVVDLSRLEYEWHAGEKRFVPWFDVVIDHDYKGQPASGRVLQSDDRVAVRYNGRSA
jgi:hypothetical protein